MKKQLIVAAVAAALTVPVASAKTTIYGRAQAELTSANGDNTDPIYMNDNGMGRWGIKATEKMGAGLTGIAHFEWQVDTDDNATGPGGSALGSRVSYVGVKGGFGFVGLGRFNSPYKTYGGTKHDPFVATNLEARNGGGHSRGAFGTTSFLSDVVYYESPNMGGFQFAVAINPEDEDEKANNGYFSAAGKFKNGPMEIVAAYSDEGDGTNRDRWKLAGTYTFAKKHTIAVNYEEADNYNNGLGGESALRRGLGSGGGVLHGGGADAEFMWLAYIGKFGNNHLKVEVGNEEYDNVAGADVMSYGVSLRHKMSKTFSVYGGYKRYDVDFNAGGDENVDVLSVGMRKDFKASIK